MWTPVFVCVCLSVRPQSAPSSDLYTSLASAYTDVFLWLPLCHCATEKCKCVLYNRVCAHVCVFVYVFLCVLPHVCLSLTLRWGRMCRQTDGNLHWQQHQGSVWSVHLKHVRWPTCREPGQLSHFSGTETISCPTCDVRMLGHWLQNVML